MASDGSGLSPSCPLTAKTSSIICPWLSCPPCITLPSPFFLLPRVISQNNLLTHKSLFRLCFSVKSRLMHAHTYTHTHIHTHSTIFRGLRKYNKLCLLLFFLFFSFFFRAVPLAYGNSQARGRIRATAAGLHHSQSNTGSKLHLGPILQLMATPDP